MQAEPFTSWSHRAQLQCPPFSPVTSRQSPALTGAATPSAHISWHHQHQSWPLLPHHLHKTHPRGSTGTSSYLEEQIIRTRGDRAVCTKRYRKLCSEAVLGTMMLTARNASLQSPSHCISAQKAVQPHSWPGASQQNLSLSSSCALTCLSQCATLCSVQQLWPEDSSK